MSHAGLVRAFFGRAHVQCHIDNVWYVVRIMWNVTLLCEQHSVIDLTSTRSILSNTSIRLCTRFILRSATDLMKYAIDSA